jgi:hypothetical protein
MPDDINKNFAKRLEGPSVSGRRWFGYQSDFADYDWMRNGRGDRLRQHAEYLIISSNRHKFINLQKLSQGCSLARPWKRTILNRSVAPYVMARLTHSTSVAFSPFQNPLTPSSPFSTSLAVSSRPILSFCSAVCCLVVTTDTGSVISADSTDAPYAMASSAGVPGGCGSDADAM